MLFPIILTAAGLFVAQTKYLAMDSRGMRVRVRMSLGLWVICMWT